MLNEITEIFLALTVVMFSRSHSAVLKQPPNNFHMTILSSSFHCCMNCQSASKGTVTISKFIRIHSLIMKQQYHKLQVPALCSILYCCASQPRAVIYVP